MAEAQTTEPRVIPYVMAITEGIRQVLLEQDDAFVAGEDVAGAGGVYGTFTGLLDEFGERRVVDTPISEAGIVGLAVGAAATGSRPIVDVMFMDFLGECMDEVANQLAVALEVSLLREAVLRDRANRQFKALAQDSNDLILLVDPDSLDVEFVGPTIERLLGYDETERNVLDDRMAETLREFSTLDGAFVISRTGVVQAAGVRLLAGRTEGLPPGLGARHAAAAGISATTKAIAITVSQSDGTVRVFRAGSLVASFDPPKR